MTDEIFECITCINHKTSMRLGQILLNAIPVGKDLFYIKDSDLLEYLRVYWLLILDNKHTINVEKQS